jgi:hypothetical protein
MKPYRNNNIIVVILFLIILVIIQIVWNIDLLAWGNLIAHINVVNLSNQGLYLASQCLSHACTISMSRHEVLIYVSFKT